jgi:hypothetical protein
MSYNEVNKIIWEVQHAPLPVFKYCKKCGRKTEYKSSGLFRVNAQRKSLDIWLIYKCQDCSTTWNVTIFSRMNPKAFDPDLLERFHNNDEVLAHDYAMNSEILHGEVGNPNYTIIGDTLPCQEDVVLQIKTNYPSPIKVATILRDKLSLSRRRYEEMLANGQIRSFSTKDLRKCKLLDGIKLMIHMDEE